MVFRPDSYNLRFHFQCVSKRSGTDVNLYYPEEREDEKQFLGWQCKGFYGGKI